MFRLKRVVAIVLLLLVIGVGTPQVFAEDGPTEIPGKALCSPTETTGATEVPGDTGSAELPDIINGIVYLISTLIP